MGRPRKFTHTSLSKVVRLQLAIRISKGLQESLLRQEILRRIFRLTTLNAS